MEAVDEPVILIAGGLDRGMDMAELVPVFRERVKALVLIGQTRFKLEQIGKLAGVGHIEVIDAVDGETAIREATRRAASLAAKGEAVILNPACASWDMFPSFEERGRMFKESLHNLK